MELRKRQTSIIEKLLLLAVLVYYVLIDAIGIFVGREGSRLGGAILAGQIFIILFFFCLKTGGFITIKFSLFHGYLLIFITYCFVNCFWAIYKSAALARSVSLAETAILMFLLYLVFDRDKDAVDHLLTIIMIGGFLQAVLFIFAYGWSQIIFSMRNADRISSDIINANTLGMAAAYSCVIFAHRIMEHKTQFWQIILAALSLVILSASQSRKALLLLILGVTAIFIINNSHEKKALKRIGRVILLAFLTGGILYVMSFTGFLSGITTRMQGLLNALTGVGVIDKSTIMRGTLRDFGIQLFKDHPIGGVGIDCARFFTIGLFDYGYHTHNNYVELLADGGILGLVAYYWLYLHMLIQMLKHRDFSDPEFNICLIILILRLIMDYGFYSFKEKSTYLFLLLIYLSYRKTLSKPY